MASLHPASILGRDRQGNVVLERRDSSQSRRTASGRHQLIAEPWDAAGLYQVGGFPFGRRWSEWNGQFRDTFAASGEETRAFPHGHDASAAVRLVRGDKPPPSIPSISSPATTGFTLHDLVSYNANTTWATVKATANGADENSAGIAASRARPTLHGSDCASGKPKTYGLAASRSGRADDMAAMNSCASQKAKQRWCQDSELSAGLVARGQERRFPALRA